MCSRDKGRQATTYPHQRLHLGGAALRSACLMITAAVALLLVPSARIGGSRLGGDVLYFQVVLLPSPMSVFA